VIRATFTVSLGEVYFYSGYFYLRSHNINIKQDRALITVFFLFSDLAITEPDMFVDSVPTDDLVSLMMEEAEKLCEMSLLYSPTTTVMAEQLGRTIYARYRMNQCLKRNMPEQVSEM